jgi:hypothetical protein
MHLNNLNAPVLNVLKEVVDELISTQMIIRILQKELLSPRTIMNAHTNDLVSTEEPGNQSDTKEWTLVASKKSHLQIKKNVTNVNLQHLINS